MEVVLKLLPGKITTARVASMAPMNTLGQVAPSGVVPTAPEGIPASYAVMLTLDDETVIRE